MQQLAKTTCSANGGTTGRRVDHVREWQKEADFSVPPVNAGIITRLYFANLATMKLALEVADTTDEKILPYIRRLRRTYGLLHQWGSCHSASAGALDRCLQKSVELRDNTIELLAGIGEILSQGMWSPVSLILNLPQIGVIESGAGKGVNTQGPQSPPSV